MVEDKKMYINYHNEAVQIVQDSISTALPDINNLNRGLTYPIYQVIPYGITEDREKDILNILRNSPAATYWEIAETLHISRKTVAQEIKVLKDSGLIVRMGSAKKGYWKEI